MNMPEFTKALQIAADAHQGQKDRFGQPFVLHPIRVMLRMNPARDEELAAALLHDVIERSPWSLDDLEKAGVSQAVLVAVEHLTKKPEESYMDYIHRVRGNALAVVVKKADLEDHLEALRTRGLLENDPERKARYDQAFQTLNAGGGRSDNED